MNRRKNPAPGSGSQKAVPMGDSLLDDRLSKADLNNCGKKIYFRHEGKKGTDI